MRSVLSAKLSPVISLPCTIIQSIMSHLLLSLFAADREHQVSFPIPTPLPLKISIPSRPAAQCNVHLVSLSVKSKVRISLKVGLLSVSEQTIKGGLSPFRTLKPHISLNL